MKTIYLTESQFNALLEEEILNENINSLLKKVASGVISAAAAIAIISSIDTISEKIKENLKLEIGNIAPIEEWKEIANDVVVTVYNANPNQCNKDVKHTASMFNLNLKDPASHRIVAMERTMMQEFGIKYGDIIKIEGTYKGLQDGIFQVQDTMNQRFAGQHKIDILVPNNVKHGGTLENTFAKVFILNDKSKEDTYRLDMAPEYNKNKI